MADLAWPRFASAPAATRSEEAVTRPPSSETAPPVTVVWADASVPDADASTAVVEPVTRSGGTVVGVREVAAPGGGAAARVQRAERDRIGARPDHLDDEGDRLGAGLLGRGLRRGRGDGGRGQGDRGEDWEQGATHAVSLDGTPEPPRGMSNSR